MVETWDEDWLIRDGFGRVLVELDWYDGLRAGLAEADGKVHYFETRNYVDLVDDVQYLVWRARDDAVAMEREQWAIYIKWRERSNTAEAESGSHPHPGHGGVDARYDELTSLLTPHRQAPADARQFVAEWRFGSGAHDPAEGLNVWVRWKPSR